MKAKLTLRMDRRLIERAKRHARRRGTSVSQMVADFFLLIDRSAETGASRKATAALIPDDYEPTPFTKSLIGAFGEAEEGVDYEEAYHRYLEDKYR